MVDLENFLSFSQAKRTHVQVRGPAQHLLKLLGEAVRLDSKTKITLRSKQFVLMLRQLAGKLCELSNVDSKKKVNLLVVLILKRLETCC